jgi:hypothetical protein
VKWTLKPERSWVGAPRASYSLKGRGQEGEGGGAVHPGAVVPEEAQQIRVLHLDAELLQEAPGLVHDPPDEGVVQQSYGGSHARSLVPLRTGLHHNPFPAVGAEIRPTTAGRGQ